MLLYKMVFALMLLAAPSPNVPFAESGQVGQLMSEAQCNVAAGKLARRMQIEATQRWSKWRPQIMYGCERAGWGV
jgi:hypothetical protein